MHRPPLETDFSSNCSMKDSEMKKSLLKRNIMSQWNDDSTGNETDSISIDTDSYVYTSIIAFDGNVHQVSWIYNDIKPKELYEIFHDERNPGGISQESIFFYDSTCKPVNSNELEPNEKDNPHRLRVGFGNILKESIQYRGFLQIRITFRSRRYCILTDSLLFIYGETEVEPMEKLPDYVIHIIGIGPWSGIHLTTFLQRPQERGFMIRNGFNGKLSPGRGNFSVLADDEGHRDSWLIAIKQSLVMNKQCAYSSSPFDYDETLEADEIVRTPESFQSVYDTRSETVLSTSDFCAFSFVDCIYENQRFGRYGWGSRYPGNLLLTDRGKYSDKSGKRSTNRFDLKGWRIDKDSFPCDEEGWEYAFDFFYFGKESWFHRSNRSTEGSLSFVRRRLWRPDYSSIAYRQQRRHRLRSNSVDTSRIQKNNLDQLSIQKDDEKDDDDGRHRSNSSPTSLDGKQNKNQNQHLMLLKKSIQHQKGLNWVVTQVILNYFKRIGWRTRKNIFERLRVVIVEKVRELLIVDKQDYGPIHELEIDELLEDYRNSRVYVWTEKQNVLWKLQKLLNTFFLRIVNHYETFSVINKSIFSHRKKNEIPKMNIVMMVVGSRGDVQPFVALGLELKKQYGHSIRIATHECFRDFVVKRGLDFYPLAGDPGMLISSLVKYEILSIGMTIDHIINKRPWIRELLLSAYSACTQPTPYSSSSDSYTCHAIYSNPHTFSEIHIAEKLGIPVHIAFTMPWTATREVQNPFLMKPCYTDQMKYLSYKAMDHLTWIGVSDLVNQFRKETLNLPPMDNSYRFIESKCVPHTYCFSEHLLPRPKDWLAYIDVSGFWFLDEETTAPYQPSKELEFFLNKNPAPIFIGFGSMEVNDSKALGQLLVDAVIQSGYRAIIQRGCADLQSSGFSDNILFVDSVPHDWLFDKCSMVVHHGGAGTTSAGLRAGKPSLIIPFFGDQFFWGSVISEMKAGPNPIPYTKLRVKDLVEAFEFALSKEIMENAKRIGSLIQNENGISKAIESFHNHLPLKTMICFNDPTHNAACIYDKKNGVQFCQDCFNHINDKEDGDRYRKYQFINWKDEIPWQNPNRVFI